MVTIKNNRSKNILHMFLEINQAVNLMLILQLISSSFSNHFFILGVAFVVGSLIVRIVYNTHQKRFEFIIAVEHSEPIKNVFKLDK